MNIQDKVLNFYKRWDVELSEDDCQKYTNFKTRTLNSLDDVLGDHFIHKYNEKKFFHLVGRKYPVSSIVRIKNKEDDNDLFSAVANLAVRNRVSKDVNRDYFSDSAMYKFLEKEVDFSKYIYYIQNIFWIENLKKELKEKLFNRIKEDIELSFVHINIVENEEDYLFYPKGDPVLDKFLINETLTYLVPYKDSCQNFKNALRQYERGEINRNLFDNIRFALEAFLKEYLKTNASLEQSMKSPLGKKMKELGVSEEIRNMYTHLINCFSKYHNEHSKHNDDVNEKEVEFMLYLTGAFIRLLVTYSK